MTERPHGAPLPDVTRADEEKARDQMLADFCAWYGVSSRLDKPLAQFLVALGWRRP